jgi:hypothetical protein
MLLSSFCDQVFDAARETETELERAEHIGRELNMPEGLLATVRAMLAAPGGGRLRGPEADGSRPSPGVRGRGACREREHWRLPRFREMEAMMRDIGLRDPQGRRWKTEARGTQRSRGLGRSGFGNEE